MISPLPHGQVIVPLLVCRSVTHLPACPSVHSSIHPPVRLSLRRISAVCPSVHPSVHPVVRWTACLSVDRYYVRRRRCASQSRRPSVLISIYHDYLRRHRRRCASRPCSPSVVRPSPVASGTAPPQTPRRCWPRRTPPCGEWSRCAGTPAGSSGLNQRNRKQSVCGNTTEIRIGRHFRCSAEIRSRCHFRWSAEIRI